VSILLPFTLKKEAFYSWKIFKYLQDFTMSHHIWCMHKYRVGKRKDCWKYLCYWTFGDDFFHHSLQKVSQNCTAVQYSFLVSVRFYIIYIDDLIGMLRHHQFNLWWKRQELVQALLIVYFVWYCFIQEKSQEITY